MTYVDQNVVVIAILAVIVLVVYYILSMTQKGRKTTRTFKRKERAWLIKEKKFILKIIKWVLLPVTIFWIVIDVAFVALANYYFHNVIFEPLFHFTPMQTLIATILLFFLGYIVYKTFITKRGAKR